MILAASKHKVDCSAPLSMDTEPRRPVSASVRRIEREHAAFELREDKRAKSVDKYRRRRMTMDDITLQEEAFQDIEREYDLIINSPPPWLPASQKTHHRIKKDQALEYGMRHKAWRRSPWPTLDAHICAAFKLKAGNTRSTLASETISRVSEGTVAERHARVNNINRSHCAGEHSSHRSPRESERKMHMPHIHSKPLQLNQSVSGNLSPTKKLHDRLISSLRSLAHEGRPFEEDLSPESFLPSDTFEEPVSEHSLKSKSGFVVVTTKLVHSSTGYQSVGVKYGIAIIRPSSTCLEILRTCLLQLKLPFQIPDTAITRTGILVAKKPISFVLIFVSY
jgi:hypothetical protein